MGTRGRIVGAAVRLFNELGTAAVSTNHIAEAAGISPGNLYYHFRNKEEIIREILERMISGWGEVWVLPRDRLMDVGYVRDLLRKNFALQWEYRFFYREIVALLRRDPELARRYREIQSRRLEEQEMFLRGFVEAGIMHEPEDPEVLAAIVRLGWVFSSGWLSFLEAGGESIEPEKMDEGVDLMMQILKPYLTDEGLAEAGASRRVDTRGEGS